MSTLVDAHAHFHESYFPADFLSAAARNFKRFDASSVGVLTLCEVTNRDPLAAFRNEVAGWESSQPDRDSILFSPRDSQQVSRRDEQKILVVAGRQLVTREKLELLALFTTSSIENGLSLSDSVDATLARDGVPVIPWGFGKWSFRRGELLQIFLNTDAISGAKPAKVLLGDSGCRTNLWRPRMLETGESLGVYVTAGSDPLPLSEHARRPGSYGTVLDECIDLNEPTTWLRDQFRRITKSPQTFGQCRSVLDFVRDQVRMRLRAK